MGFYMDDIVNMIKLHSGKQDQTYGFARHVKIKEYDPTTGRVKCAHFDPTTQDFTIMTNWMPWVTPTNGQGLDVDAGTGILWGQVFTPCIDEFAFMLPIQGDHDNGIVLGGIYTDTRPPPQANGSYAQAGEWLYVNNTGTYMYFDNKGNLNIYTDNNLNVQVQGNANITVVGDVNLTVGGNVVENVDGNVTSTIGGNMTVAVDGSMTATIGGSMTANVDGSMTADIGGSLTATTLGTGTIQSVGNLVLQSNGSIIMNAQEIINIQGNLGVAIMSPVYAINVAPIAPYTETSTIVVLPVPPFVPNMPPTPGTPSTPSTSTGATNGSGGAGTGGGGTGTGTGGGGGAGGGGGGGGAGGGGGGTGTVTGTPGNPIVVTAISLSNSQVPPNSPAGTTVGAITVATNSGAFVGSLALSGTDASNFVITNNNLVSATALPEGNYSIVITATPTEPVVTPTPTAAPSTTQNNPQVTALTSNSATVGFTDPNA
jgi:hypothetical protein